MWQPCRVQVRLLGLGNQKGARTLELAWAPPARVGGGAAGYSTVTAYELEAKYDALWVPLAWTAETHYILSADETAALLRTGKGDPIICRFRARVAAVDNAIPPESWPAGFGYRLTWNECRSSSLPPNVVQFAPAAHPNVQFSPSPL